MEPRGPSSRRARREPSRYAFGSFPATSANGQESREELERNGVGDRDGVVDRETDAANASRRKPVELRVTDRRAARQVAPRISVRALEHVARDALAAGDVFGEPGNARGDGFRQVDLQSRRAIVDDAPIVPARADEVLAEEHVAALA